MTQLALPLDAVRVREPRDDDLHLERVGRTVRDIARTIRRPAGEAQQLLDELAEQDIAVEVEVGVWRLTTAAEARYGAAFRGLSGWLEVGPV